MGSGLWVPFPQFLHASQLSLLHVFLHGPSPSLSYGTISLWPLHFLPLNPKSPASVSLPRHWLLDVYWPVLKNDCWQWHADSHVSTNQIPNIPFRFVSFSLTELQEILKWSMSIDNNVCCGLDPSFPYWLHDYSYISHFHTTKSYIRYLCCFCPIAKKAKLEVIKNIVTV